MNKRRKIHLLLIIGIIALGLPSRVVPHFFPNWYVLYAGDFFWAMLVYFLFALIFRFKPIQSLIVSLIFAYIIEITQLFHPPWLEAIRSIKIFALILGHGFLWTDLVAYTLGIVLAYMIDRKLCRI